VVAMLDVEPPLKSTQAFVSIMSSCKRVSKQSCCNREVVVFNCVESNEGLCSPSHYCESWNSKLVKSAMGFWSYIAESETPS